MDNLIPLFRLEKLYTLFYDEKDGKIYKIQHREKRKYSYLLFFFGWILLSNLIGDNYVAQNNFPLSLGILLATLVVTFFLTKIFVKRYYKQETKTRSYLSTNPAFNEVKKGRKQLRIETIMMIVFVPMFLLFLYLYFKNSQLGILFILDAIFMSFLMFSFTKPLLRKKLLEEIGAREKEGEKS